jgi:KDO2-lipid IV(A) lauroyltransferase
MARRTTLHKKKLGQLAIYTIGRSLLLGLEMAGLTAGRWIGAGFGRLLYWLDAKHRRVGIDNVLQARGMPKTEPEARRIVRGMYEHLGISMAEIAATDRLLRAGRLGELVELDGLENVREALSRGCGAILAVAHLGNWEPAGVHFSREIRPLWSIVRPLDNPLLDGYLESLRQRTGQVIISKFNAADRMREALQANQMLGVLMDQDAREGGIFVDFFGRPASTVKSAAILSLRYRSPILPLNIYRERGRIRMCFDRPIYPDVVDGRLDRVRELTQLATTRLEEYIRLHPDQWFWFHRRWRTQPRETEERRPKTEERRTKSG